MATEQLLQAEARERPRAAVLAALAALFTLVASIVGIVTLKGSPSNLPAEALFRHQHQVGLAISAACSLLGLVALVFALDFLVRAVAARNPRLPRMVRPLLLPGGLGLVAIQAAVQVISVVKLNHFATHGSQTYDEARAAGDVGALAYLGLLAQLAFAVAIVLVSVNAMRVGLVTRLVGYLGVISAVLFVVPLVPLPIVQVYWLGALSMMFAGRSPSGTPPAWESGEAMPWPSAQEMREQRIRAAEARRGGAAPEPQEAQASGAAGARRKRKKRR